MSMLGGVRTRCVVPGCRCTTKQRYSEWICRKHWQLVPVALRQLKNRVWRAWRQARAQRNQDVERKRSRQAYRVWNKCRQTAIEKAMGI